ncbi:MAG: cell division protein FtsL [Polyangiaceae bacterium]
MKQQVLDLSGAAAMPSDAPMTMPAGRTLPPRKQGAFIFVWTLAVIGAVCAFAVHLGLRGRNLELGYEIGRARSEQARLREVKRVLELEAASYKTPTRVETVARTLLGMDQATADHIVSLPASSDP